VLLLAGPRRAAWAGCGREEEWAASGENGVAFGPEQRGEGVFSFFFYFVSFCLFLFQSLFRTVENKSENILTLIKTTH
jgi:hypothetical protein